MLTILVVILLLVALGAMPTWPYSRSWGYYPSSGLGLVVLILVILLFIGRIQTLGQRAQPPRELTLADINRDLTMNNSAEDKRPRLLGRIASLLWVMVIAVVIGFF